MVPGLEEGGEAPAISSQSNALVLFNPVYDNGPDGYGFERVADRYQEISPFHNIREGCPPAIVFLGTEDKLIPVATSEAFKEKMESVGSKSVLHLYEGKPHGFFNESKGGEEIFLDTVGKMDDFLVEIGYLEGEPTEQQLKAILKGGEVAPAEKRKKKNKN
jgi:acetyl esterase/lipase